MMDAMLVGFDVAEEHSGITFNTELVSLLVDLEPSLSINFGWAYILSDIGVEDFGSAAGEE